MYPIFEMKHIKLFESITEIKVEKICKKYNITNWTLNPDGTVDVDGSVYLSGRRLSKLPLKFGRVTGRKNTTSGVETVRLIKPGLYL